LQIIVDELNTRQDKLRQDFKVLLEHWSELGIKIPS
jgi:hypothetical protein